MFERVAGCCEAIHGAVAKTLLSEMHGKRPGPSDPVKVWWHREIPFAHTSGVRDTTWR